jgi:hypothetical protein
MVERKHYNQECFFFVVYWTTLLITQTVGLLRWKQKWCNDAACYPLHLPSEQSGGFAFPCVSVKDKLSIRRDFIVEIYYYFSQNKNKSYGCWGISWGKLPKSYHLTIFSPPKPHYKVLRPSLICNIYISISLVSSVIFFYFLKEFKYVSTAVSLTLTSGTIWESGFLNRTSTWNTWEKLCLLKVKHYRRPFRSFGAWKLIIFTGPLSGAGD